MLHNYFKISLLSLLLVSVSIYPQEMKKSGGLARLMSMGRNPYIYDPFFTTINPAWGAAYDNFIFGDLGSTTGPFAPGGAGEYISANFRLSPKFTLGGLISRTDFNGASIALLDPGTRLQGGVVDVVNGLVGGGSVTPLDANLELFSSLKIDKFTLGFGLAYASTTHKVPAGTGQNIGSASQVGVNGGIIMDFSGKVKLDASLSLMFPSASFQPFQANETTASQTIIGINGRLFWKYTPKVTFVPAISFVSLSGSADHGIGNTTISGDLPSAKLFAIGFGINYYVGDFLLSGGPSFITSSVTTPAGNNGPPPELTATVTSFPVWNLGLEWNFLDWLTGRLGFVSVKSVSSAESPSGTGKVETVNTVFFPPQGGFTLGLGFKFGDFYLDGTVNEDVLRKGLSNIGNGNPSAATFAYLSAGYALP
jgi:hypothetical protein